VTFLLHLLTTLVALAPGHPSGASAVLHDWDDRRAAAWSAGDVGALRSLYVARSPAGRADVAMLRAWRDRDLRIEGMRMQLLDLDVRRASADRLDLVVTDRLTGAVGVGPGVRLPLPQDRISSRRLVMVERQGVWRVAEVTAAADIR
jgi:hypothetical protein